MLNLGMIMVSLLSAGCNSTTVITCDGLELCETEGTACDGTVLTTCTLNAEGCQVKTVADCAISGLVCDDANAVARCACVDDADCASRELGDSYCDADVAVTCVMAGECISKSPDDCAAAGGTCDDSTGEAVCDLPDSDTDGT